MAHQTDEDAVVTIVGSGRIGTALNGMSPFPTKVVVRGGTVSVEDRGPIIVCTRNDDLDCVIEATPITRHPDLVFIQNGMLLPFLEERGLQDNTQGLVYFGVSKLGSSPMDGITDLDPDGLTTVYGRHANTMCEIIKAGGLTCKVAEKESFLTAMLEKLIWISAVMLVGAEHSVNVGEVDKKHSTEVAELMNELGDAGSKVLNVPVSENMVERLGAYSRAVASFPCAVKEFRWRNGWFYGLSEQAASAGKQDPCPMHTELLKKLGIV